MSACCSSRSRATSSSSQGTTVTVTPPTGFTARPRSADEGAEHRREEPQAVGAAARSGRPVGAEAPLDRMLRMRHEAHHVAGFVGDPGDVAAGSVRVPAGVAEHDTPLCLELVERPLVRDKLPVLVLQRDGDPLADRVLPGPGGIDVLHRQLLPGAMIKNDHRAFVCREQQLSVQDVETAWTRQYTVGERITIPLKNQDGQFVADERTLDRDELPVLVLQRDGDPFADRVL